MNDITQKKIKVKVEEVSSNGNGTQHVSFVLDEEINTQPGQYIIFTFEKDGKSFEHKHTILNRYSNSKKIEEDINFKDFEREFFLPVLKKDAVFYITGPVNFPFGEKLKSKLSTLTINNTGSKIIVVVALIVIILGGFLGKDKVMNFLTPVSKPKIDDVIKLSNLGTDQKPIQDFFVAQVKDGKNDADTQAALMWITHRYFDNGGDIYEIYDYVNAHPEISFLKEAEKIHPEVFSLIKEKKVKKYDSSSLIALLAYFEIADKYNYANIGMLGLAANKYAELAFYSYNTANATNVPAEEIKFSRFYKEFKNKSLSFSMKVNKYINERIKTTGKINDLENAGIRDDTLVVGLNQFASAQYFYKGMDMPFLSIIPPDEIFKFNVDFTRRKFVRLYLFTNYLWATSLVNGKSANIISVSTPLNNIIEYARANKNIRPEGSLSRIIHSNTNGENSIFSYENAKALAKVFTPFKDWLRETGWKEADFK